jgi:hypothetical protein
MDTKIKTIHVTKQNLKDLFSIVDETRYSIRVFVRCDDIDVITSAKDLQLIIDIIDMCIVDYFYITCNKIYFKDVNTRMLCYNLTDDGKQIYIYS